MKKNSVIVHPMLACFAVLLLTMTAGTVLAGAPSGPTITLQPHDITAAIGGVTNLSVQATGTGTLTYKWKFNNNPPLTSSSNLVFSPVADSQAGTYLAIVTDSTGSVTSAPPVVFNVIHPPAISSQPESQVVAAGDDVFFDVEVNGTKPFSYLWYKNGGALAGESLAVLELDGVSQANAGSYALAITNIDGTATSSSALLSVVAPAFIASQSLSVPLNKCSALTLTADVATAGDDLHYRWSFNGSPVGTDSPTYTVSAGLDFTDAGTYTVVITNDVADVPPVTVTTNITVVDPFPVITGCPSDIITTTAGPTPTCGQNVTWIAPQATDNCSVGSFTSNFRPGCYFPVGTTLVTYTATDDATQVTRCSFSVTVNDVTPPTVLAHDLTVCLDASGNASITAAQIDNGSTDNCGIASSNVFPNTFSCANVGPNTVTLTVVDIHGNSNTATATVTIKDKTPPTVVTKNATVYLDHAGHGSITTNDINSGSSDSCGIASMTLSKCFFGEGDTGDNTVTLTVTDVNGNSAQGTATVTVIDNIPPDAAAANITVYLDSTGSVSITGLQVDGGSFDAGGIATYSVDKTTFHCSDVGSNVVTLTVTDPSGNSSTAQGSVTVVDNIAPTVSFNTISVQLDAAGDYVFAQSDIDTLTAGSTDVCGILTNGISPSSVNFTDVGTTKSITVSVTDVNGNVGTSTGNITVLAPINPPNYVYVDGSYGTSGAVTFPNVNGQGNYYIGYNAFATVQAGIDAVATNGTVFVAPGTYAESINIPKGLSLLGPNATIAGTNSSRTAEAILTANATGPNVFTDDLIIVNVAADSVVIDGFTIDGDNTNLSGGEIVGSADVDAAEGISSSYGVGGIHVVNNIIKNLGYAGVDFDNDFNNAAATSDSHILNNYFTNIGSITNGYGLGVVLQENFFADVSGNTMDKVRVGVQTGDYTLPTPNAHLSISSNTISCSSVGIYHNLFFQNADTITIANNVISAYDEPSTNFWRGILVKSMQDGVGVNITSNTVSGGATTRASVGYMVWNCPTTQGIVVNGGTVTGANYGAWVNNYEGDNTFVHAGSSGQAVTLTLSGVSIYNAGIAGAYVKDNPLSGTHSNQVMILTNNCLITNSATAVLVDGAATSVTLNNTGLGNAAQYIVLTNGAAAGIDATQVRFDGHRGSTATLSQLYTAEDKIQHKVDDATLGFVRVKSGNVYVTANSFVTPDTTGADIQRGLNAASSGDTVNVAAGTFTNNLVISQSVVLAGANVGIDAQTGSSRNAETIIDGQNLDAAVAINASSVTVDGFTIEHGANGNFQSGVWMVSSGNDQHVRNNIITQNAIGLAAGCSGTSTIRNNLFTANVGNALDAVFNTVNLSIHNNEFSFQTGGNPILLEATVPDAHTGIKIYQNTFHDNANASAIYALGITSGSISNNVITAPGATALSFSGANHGVLVKNNFFSNADRGIRVEDAGYTAGVLNSGIAIHANSFTGFASPTLDSSSSGYYAVGNVTGGDSDAILDATTNWWGNVSGPFSATLNVYGTGGGVTDNVKISPWLGSGTDTSLAIGFQPGNTLNTPPTHLIFTRQPGNANLYSLLAPQPIVAVHDASGHTTPWANPPVTMTIANNPNQGVLNGTNPQSGSSGSVSFSGLSIGVGGGFNYTLTASASNLTSATSQGFDIRNPDPDIFVLSPFWTRAGSGAFSLTVIGTNFVPNSTVRWNGSSRTTHYVSATQLTADIRSTDVNSVTTAHVSVVDPTPGGGSSSSLDFRVLSATINTAFVDDSYAGFTNDTQVAWPYTGSGSHIIGYDAFATIQTGVNTVNPNGTVNVAAGTYPENVNVNKTVSLLGANANRDPRIQRRVGFPRVAESIIDGGSTEAAVTILSSGTSVNGFTIQNGAGGSYNSGVWMYGGAANISVQNNILTNNNIGVAAACAGTSSIATNLFIANNNPLGNPVQNAGIDGYANTTNLTIVNNEFTGHTNGNPILLEATGTNEHNGLVVTRNNFHDNSNASAVYVLGVTSGTFTRNTFTAPGATCLSFSGGNNGVTVQNNFFSGADRGIRVEDVGYPNLFANSGVVISDNSFTGFASPATDTFYAVGNIAGGDSDSILNASGNWWSGNTTSVVEVATFGSVDYTPWLDDGTDTSLAAPGFQGDLSTVHVDINSPQADVTGRIQEGVNLATDTVLIETGLYQENVTVTDDISLIGTGSGSTIITAANVNLPVINLVNAEGSSSHNKLLVENLGVIGSYVSGLQVTASSQSLSYLHFENVYASGNNSTVNNTLFPVGPTGNGITLTGTHSIQNVEIINCSLDGNGAYGLYIDTGMPFVTSIDLLGGEVKNNGVYGVSLTSLDGTFQIANDLTIANVAFAYNGNPQLIVPTVQPPVAPVDFGDIRLTGFNGDATISNVTINVSGLTAIELAGKLSGGAHPSLSGSGNVLLKNLVVSGSPGGSAFSIARYSDVRNITLSGVDLSGVSVATVNPIIDTALSLGSTGSRRLNLADTKFPAVPAGYYDIVITNSSGATVTCSTVFVGANTPQAQSAVVLDANTPPNNPHLGIGVVQFPIFVITPSTNIVQEAVSAAGNNVSFTVTAFDACDNAPVITSTPASGALFPVGTTTVTNVVVDSRGDSNMATFTVTVQDTTPPVLSCPTNMVVINDPGQTYATVNFPTPVATDNTTVDSIVYTPPAGTQFPKGSNSVHIVVTDHYGNTNACDFGVTVNDVPVITHQPHSLVRNAGQSANFCVTVTGTDPFVYQWFHNGSALSDDSRITGSTGSAINLQQVTKADAGSYTVVITNIAGMATSCVATLTVIDPFIVTQPQNITTPLGSATNLFVVAGGAQPFFYQWFQNGITLVGSTNSVLNFASLHDSDGGSYNVVVTNSQGSILSSNAIIVIKHPPVITFQPTNLFLPVGAQASFNVSANGNAGPFVYQWLKNGSSMSPLGTAKKLILNNIQLTDSGSYSVYITNNDGNTTSSNAILRVFDHPTIVLQPVSQTNDAGTTVIFSVAATSDVPLTYHWLKNGANMTNGGKIFGVLTTNLTITNVLGADGASYTVSVSNSVGPVLSQVATLTVYDPVITQQPTNLVVIEDRTAIFKVKAVGTALQYQWVLDGFNLEDETNASLSLPNVADSDQGQYLVIVSSDYGAVTSSIVTLTTIPPVISQQPQDEVVFVGQVATFSVSVNGGSPLTYQWYKNGNILLNETNRILTFFVPDESNSGGYSVFVTNPQGSDLSRTATLVVSPAPASRVVPVSLINGIFTVQVVGNEGLNYVLQASTNMMIWNPVATNTSPFIYDVPVHGPDRVMMYRAYYAPVGP